MHLGSRRHEPMVVFTHDAPRDDTVKTIMHVRNNYGHLGMTRSEKQKTERIVEKQCPARARR